MLYRKIIAVCSEIHTKYINVFCLYNIEFFFHVKPAAVQSKPLECERE